MAGNSPKPRFKNVYFYGLSPFYQKAFPNFFTKELPKYIPGFFSKCLLIGPYAIATILLINWAKEDARQRIRKDYTEYGLPADYGK